jgi:hypothetical protein
VYQWGCSGGMRRGESAGQEGREGARGRATWRELVRLGGLRGPCSVRGWRRCGAAGALDALGAQRRNVLTVRMPGGRQGRQDVSRGCGAGGSQSSRPRLPGEAVSSGGRRQMSVTTNAGRSAVAAPAVACHTPDNTSTQPSRWPSTECRTSAGSSQRASPVGCSTGLPDTTLESPVNDADSIQGRELCESRAGRVPVLGRSARSVRRASWTCPKIVRWAHGA